MSSEAISSNPVFSTKKQAESLVNTGDDFSSAPKKIKSAPSMCEYSFEVEGPDSIQTTEMKHQIKINDCSGDLSKRWYVEYYTLANDGEKSKRVREYGYVNKHKTIELRYQALSDLKLSIIKKLEFKVDSAIDFSVNDSNSITYYLNHFLAVKRKSIEKRQINTILVH